jgi:hypothetical protein
MYVTGLMAMYLVTEVTDWQLDTGPPNEFWLSPKFGLPHRGVVRAFTIRTRYY